MNMQLFYFSKSLLLIILLFNINSVFSSEDKSDNDIFIIKDDRLRNIPRSYLKFLDNSNYDMSLEELKNSYWSNNLISQQSFYDGYWVKVKIHNLSSTSEMGIHHNWNFEKRIIYKNSMISKSFNFLDYNNDNYEYIDKDRIWYDYKINMPKGDITEIYSYFRSRPLDRMNSHSN